jgi:maltose alpha-D-glucosyltransferase/alpha-amylase
VLVEMCRNFLHWLSVGVDGFRADAIPYLWKEEGTDCENLPQTHLLVKFFRQVLDWARPNTLLLAEACQKPVEVVKYFGQGDECHAGYHFPLMPQLFKSIAAESALPVIQTLSEEITPPIPESSQWFTFLRCHDELSLELVYVSEEDRKYIHDHYCKEAQWDFRQGQGISARLSELMDRDPQKILLAYAMMLSLPGTPVIYYGDEFGKTNDEAYYHQQIKAVGKDDTRFLVRGRIDWDALESEMKTADSLAARVFPRVKTLINVRNLYPAFGKGGILWLKATDASGKIAGSILAFIRKQRDADILCLFNLAENQITFRIEGGQFSSFEMIAGETPVYQAQTNQWTLPGRSWQWIKIS